MKRFLPAVEVVPVLMAGLVASLVPADDPTVVASVEEGWSVVVISVDSAGALVLTVVLVASLVPAEDTTVDATVVGAAVVTSVEEGLSEVGAGVDSTGEVAPVLGASLVWADEPTVVASVVEGLSEVVINVNSAEEVDSVLNTVLGAWLVEASVVGCTVVPFV